jgi:hypothetical protein
MSLLTVVTRFCERINLNSPATVYGSTDPQISQIKALLEAEGNDLAKRGDWNELTCEAVHTTLATESQGAISTVASNGFRNIKPDTLWDRTLKLPLYILDDVQWQAQKGFATTSPNYSVRLRGGLLLSTPIPAAGNTWAFEYFSKNWILGIDGTTYKQYFTLDTDTMLLPEELLTLGLIWRWKKEKGFDYAEDFRTYESQVNQALGSNGLKKSLNMTGNQTGRQPHIATPQGNWAVP